MASTSINKSERTRCGASDAVACNFDESEDSSITSVLSGASKPCTKIKHTFTSSTLEGAGAEIRGKFTTEYGGGNRGHRADKVHSRGWGTGGYRGGFVSEKGEFIRAGRLRLAATQSLQANMGRCGQRGSVHTPPWKISYCSGEEAKMLI